MQIELPSEPVSVNADPKRIIQVVAKVISNASKFMPDGGNIRIRLHANDAAAELTVSDTGVGMEAALVARVFDPFMQKQRGLDRTQGGLGLGLALAKSLMELHGGSITAASPGVERGSSFLVWVA